MAANRYWPSLDGARGAAIAVVVAYHLGYLGGGWVGVDVFFVLSGFLITSLLLEERARHGRVALRAFWARRAKRLLPALLLVLALIALYAWAGGASVVPAQLRSPAVATMFYVANWQQIAAGHGYFSQFEPTGPLRHMWSLAIEEQYYLVWPLLFGALTWLGRRRGVRALALPVALLAAGSAVWMGVCAHVLGVDRAYLGTDTRAWELLLGAFGALAVQSMGPIRHRRAWALSTVTAAGAVVVGTATAGGPPSWIWDGGLVAMAVGVLVVVVGSVRDPDGPVARFLAVAPLRWLGRISYSLYLWHWPVIVLMTGRTTGLSGTPLLACRLAAMLAGSWASYALVEIPMRRADWTLWWRRAQAPAAVVGVVGIVLAATVPPVEASTGAVAAAPATRAAGDITPVALPAGRVPSPADPLRVWILGDSVMADSAPGLTAALESTGDARVVADSAFGGWGLTTDHLWPGDAAQIIATYHPEVVVGTWSWDVVAAQQDPQAYLIRLIQALDAVLTPGNGVDLVVLLQFPQLGPNPYWLDPATQHAAWAAQNARQIVWNTVARQAVRFFPGRALYLPTDQLFAPGDRYFTWRRTPTGSWLRARKIDDLHMCPYGAAQLGGLVVHDLTPVLGLAPMAPGWEAGAWTTSANYDDPPGACPDDQPPPGYAGVPVPGPPS